MVGCCVLDDEALVSFNCLENMGLLDSPFTDVGPVLLGL